MVISVDWGGYDYDALQVENLATKANCGAFISQLGGAGTPKLLKRARDAGMITGGYYWNSALNSVQFQLDQFSQWIDADNPDIIILDIEHWWAKWDQYWAAIAGTLPWARVEKLPPQKISDNAQAVCEGMIKRYPNKYYLNYSAQWFVNGYSPQCSFWMKNYSFHVAAYPDYGMPPYTLTWEQIAAGNFVTVRSGMQTITDYKPSMPVGMFLWDMWQYSSRIKVPGEYYGYDWNYFPGTLDQLKEKCHIYTTTPPVPITCEETEAKLAAMMEWYKEAPIDL